MKYTIKTNAIAVLLAVILLCATAGCAALAEADMLKLPTALKRIETEAFYGDQAIRNVVVPEGVKRIGARAFHGSGLRMIQLPASVTAIDGDPFDGSDKVRVVAPEGAYACQWAEEHGYAVSHEAQKWVVDKAAWTETTERKLVVICGGCGRYFLSYDDLCDHELRIAKYRSKNKTDEIYEETSGGLEHPGFVPDRTGNSCSSFGSAYINIPLDTPIEHPEEGHYETIP